MVFAITILSLLLAGAAIIFVFGVKALERLTDEIRYQEHVIEAKNKALSYYVDAHQKEIEISFDLRHEINMLKNAKKPVGRPKGSKNKVTKPKFDKQKFNDKYGK